MPHLLVAGARSDIARAVADLYAANGYDVTLAARTSHTLEPFAADLRLKHGVGVTLADLDVLDYDSHAAFYAELATQPDGVFCAVGYLGDHERALTSGDELRLILDTNFTGVAHLLGIVAGDMERREKGFIIVVSSVAGDRGRASNYVYGAAKAGLTAYLSGLRNRLHAAGVPVLTVKPGFVDTQMTEGLDLPASLTAQPDEVARSIFKAQQKQRDLVYAKPVWRLIMFAIRGIPERVFKRMSL